MRIHGPDNIVRTIKRTILIIGFTLSCIHMPAEICRHTIEVNPELLLIRADEESRSTDISYPGTGFYGEDGKPAVPQMLINFHVPLEARDLSVSLCPSSDTMPIGLNFPIRKIKHETTGEAIISSPYDFPLKDIGITHKTSQNASIDKITTKKTLEQSE